VGTPNGAREMPRRRLKYFFLLTFVPPLIAFALWLLRLTLRIEYRNDQPMLDFVKKKRTIVFAFWHADLAMVLFVARDYTRRVGHIGVLASRSEDGELLARTLRIFGFDAVRGSSSRGARAGLVGLEQYLAKHGHIGIAVDGPRGPRHKTKVGVALIARNAGAPIIPFNIQYERVWRLRSWDRTEIPKPFSRCIFTFHPPITVPLSAERDDLERVREQVETILLENTQKESL